LEDQVTLTEKQALLDRLYAELGRYEEAYFETTVGGGVSRDFASLRLDQLTAQFEFYQGLYTNLLSEYETARMATMNDRVNIVQVDEARVQSQPVRPRPGVNVLAGVMLGLLLCGGVAFLVEYADDTIKSPDAAGALLDLPLVGVTVDDATASNRSLTVNLAPRSAYAESVRTVRTNLEFAQVDGPLRTLMISSPMPADGKTTLTANLAVAIAQAGKRVIVVDADLRKPRLHEMFEASNQFGLTTILTHQLALEDGLQQVQAHPNVLLLTSGKLPPNPTELLASEAMLALLEQLKQRADVVLIDASPFVVADPSVLAARVDGTLVVVRYAKTRGAAAQSMVEQLRRTKGRILGIVVTRFKPRSGSHYYYYYGQTYFEEETSVDGMPQMDAPARTG
jgi:capsular exopolysaccharide synthesis family protein